MVDLCWWVTWMSVTYPVCHCSSYPVTTNKLEHVCGANCLVLQYPFVHRAQNENVLYVCCAHPAILVNPQHYTSYNQLQIVFNLEWAGKWKHLMAHACL